MALKRNKDIVPEWGSFEYATLCKSKLFSEERWGKKVEWNKLLEQTMQIEHAIGLLVKAPYPTRLFLSYIDILEANLFIFDDMFYFLTGGYLTDGIKNSGYGYDETWENLQFWNIDCHSTILEIADSLSKSQNTFRNILQRSELRSLLEIMDCYCEPDTEELSAKISPEEESVYSYIKNIYEGETIDILSLANQIEMILDILEQHTDYMYQWAHGWYADCFLLGDFNSLLDKFTSSERGIKLVQGWDNELNGTRERLIESLERNNKFQPWVYQYCHLSDKKNIIHELFALNNSSADLDIEKLYNTDNWISILSIAAILQEHDKHQEIINQLKPFFYNVEEEAWRFYKAIKGATPTMITSLVNKLGNDKIISDTSKSLYDVLHKNDLYPKTYANWIDQIKVKH